MRRFLDLYEASQTIVFAFGRFNPPTTGHEKLISKVASIARSNPYRIYPSFTTNPKKDPLPHSLKVAYMRKMFPKHRKNIIADTKMKTAIFIAEAVYKEGFKNLIMVAGSDRVKEFSELLTRYNDAPDKQGNQLFKFDSVKVVSAGERDPDSEGVSGMSASKMRAAAADGDKDAFLTGVPSSFKDGEKLYRDVRKYMGIREERDMGDMTDFEAVRDMFLTGKIWNAGDIVEANGVTGEVVRKGTNYLSFVDEDGKVHKAWLHEIELDEKYDSDKFFSGKGTPEQRLQLLKLQNKALRALGGSPKQKAIKKEIDALRKKMGMKVKEEIEIFDEGFLDKLIKIKDVAKDKMNKLKKALSTETTETKKMLRIYKNRKNASKDEIKYANDQFKDILKGLGLIALSAVPVPASGLFIAALSNIAKKKFNINILPSAFYEEVELDERNYRKEYDNYQGRPEQIARRSSRNQARRILGDKTKIGMDVGHKDNNPLNNDPKNLKNEDPSKNRREPRLREVDEDLITFAPWLKKLKDKIFDKTHTKGLNNLSYEYVKQVVKLTKEKKPIKHMAIVHDIAKPYSDVTDKILRNHINDLVKKGLIPQELKAKYEPVHETMSFKDFVNQIQVKEVKQDSDIKDKKGTQPAKYYAGDMAKSTKKKRDAHFRAKKSGPAPGDSAKTKPSVHTKKFKQMFGEVLPDSATQKDYINDFEKSDAPQFQGKSKEKRREMAIAAYLSKNESLLINEKITGLVNKAEKSGMPYGILKKVYDRGLAAYKTGHRPGATAQQWAFARVNSFVTKSAGTWGKADADLAKQVKEENELNVWGEITEKDDKSGKELNNPTKGDIKKYKVYVRNDKGNVVKVEFGDPNMEIKRDDPARRKAFRARHGCDNPGPKWKAKYWSCKFWSGKSVTDLMKG